MEKTGGVTKNFAWSSLTNQEKNSKSCRNRMANTSCHEVFGLPNLEAQVRGPNWRLKSEAQVGDPSRRSKLEAQVGGSSRRPKSEAQVGGPSRKPKLKAQVKGPSQRLKSEAQIRSLSQRLKLAHSDQLVNSFIRVVN